MTTLTQSRRARGGPAALVAGVALLAAMSAPSALAQGLKPARVATASGVASPITANILIGKYLGYYKEEGLDFQLATMGARGTVAIMNAFDKGSADFGTFGASSLVRMEKQGVNLDLKAVYCYTREFPERLVVLKSSPIHTIDELKGKKVGVRSMARVSFAKALLQSSGASPAAYQYVPVGIGSGPFLALKKGDVSALSLFDVDLRRVASLGADLRYLPVSHEWESLQGPIIVTTDKMIENDPQRIIGFGRALAKGTVFALTNPEATVRIFYKMYPQAVPKGRSLEAAVKNTTDIFKARLPRLTMKDRKTQKWGYMEEDAWRSEVKLMVPGYKPKKPITEYFTNRFIDQINDFDQQAVVEQAKNFKMK